MTHHLSAFATWFTRATVIALMLTLVACTSPEEKAKTHLKRGQELLEKKDYTSASLEFRNAVKFDEKLTDAWLGLSKILEHEQNWAGVSRTLTKVLELDPNNFEANFRLSKFHLFRGGDGIQMALRFINKANDLKADDSNVFATRAAILLRLKDRSGALRDAEQALSLNPDNPDAFAVLAADKFSDKDSKGAILMLDRGLAADEDNIGLLLFKLRILEEMKLDPELEQLIRKLIEFYPDVVAYRQAMIKFLSTRQRQGEAEAEMRALVTSQPDNTKFALQLVGFIANQRGSDDARNELDRLIAAHPDVVDYKLAKAELNLSKNRSDQAIATLNAVIAKGEPEADVLRARVMLANIRQKIGQTDDAKKLVDEILKSDEKNSDALALRAKMRLEDHQVDGAIADLREALSQDPESVPLLELLGNAFDRQGAIDLAEDRFSKAAELSRFEPQLTLRFMNFLIRRGKNEQAEQLLVEAAGQNPASKEILTALAQARLRKQDWTGAEEVAEALEKLEGASGVSAQIKGAALIGQKKFDQSIDTLQGVLSQTPGAASPMLALVTAYVQAGKLDEAEEFINGVIKANASNPEAHVLMGSLRMVQKKPAEAEAAYKMAIKAGPKNGVGYAALGKHYIGLGKAKEAEELFRAGRSKVPNDLGLGLTLAGLLEQRGDIEEAIKLYEEILQTRPNALVVINNLASLLVDHRDDEESLRRAGNLAQRLQSTELPYFKDTLGWIAYRRGEYRAALSYLENAVAKLPKLNLVRYHLGMTYVALERTSDAKAEFAKALELSPDDDLLRPKIEAAMSKLQ